MVGFGMTLLTLPSDTRLAPPRWVPLAAVSLVALVTLHIAQTNPDVSWGLTMAEKWLDGSRLYVDIVEVNPPATLFLYVGPVWLARQIGLAPEMTADVMVLLAAALSIFIAARILSVLNLRPPERGWRLMAMTAAVLVILPGQNFGEREHIALITMLPLLAVNMIRANHLVPSSQMAIIAGIGAGITAIIKPYFAAAVLCSSVVAALAARSWRVMFALENWISAALLAVYFVFVWRAYPTYVNDMVPLLTTIYLPAKESLAHLLIHIAMPLWALMLFMLWGYEGMGMFKPPSALLLAASVGFAISYLVQQKGWPNHSYPMLALALLAFGNALLTARDGWRDRLMGRLSGLIVAGMTFYWMNMAKGHADLVMPIRTIAPHAKILAIANDFSIGHPTTRAAGGVWVSRVSSLWITQGVRIARAKGGLNAAALARLDGYAERDRIMLSEDIANNRPDIILVQRDSNYDWLAWAYSNPVLAGELKAYRPVQTYGTVLILHRER
jgi:hypothetical protein